MLKTHYEINKIRLFIFGGQHQQQQQSLHPGAAPFNTDDEFPLVSRSHHTLRVEFFSQTSSVHPYPRHPTLCRVLTTHPGMWTTREQSNRNSHVSPAQP